MTISHLEGVQAIAEQRGLTVVALPGLGSALHPVYLYDVLDRDGVSVLPLRDDSEEIEPVEAGYRLEVIEVWLNNNRP